MTTQQQIIQKLEEIPKDELLRNMGYRNLNAGYKTLNNFINTESIYSWLKRGSFDMKYNSESFLMALLKAINLSTPFIEKEIQQSQKRLESLSNIKATSIFIDTHFKRKGESIFALGMMEELRRISIGKEMLVFKSKTEILEEIGKIIREHYTKSEGKIKLWGEIYMYVYHHNDGNTYTFNPEGILLKEHQKIVESKAELRIGNQIIN